jgi:plasmid stability protein
MPPKGESVQTYLPPEIKRKLEAWAAAEQRSISFLAAQILTEAIASWESQQDKPPVSSTSAKGTGGKRKTKGGDDE